MIYGVVLCIGDSLLTGARDEAGFSVPKLLGDELSTDGQQWIAVDEGINGETTGSLLRHLYRTVRSYPEARDVVISVGINDAKEPGLLPAYFERNFNEMFKTLLILKSRCYVCLIPNRRGFGAPDYVDNALISEYNKIIRNLLSVKWRHAGVIVDLTKVSSGHRADGVHFNLEGDRWAARTIASVIKKARS